MGSLYKLERMIIMMVIFPLLSTLAFSNSWFNYQEAMWLREHCGVYAWQKDARFNDWTLLELVEMAKEFGVKIIRIPLNAYYGGDENFPKVLSSPIYRMVFEKFPVVILTMWDWSGRQYDENWTEKVYYEACRYLLEKYKGTGKTIVIGIWESDNWAPLDDRGIGFFLARQRGIKRAKKEFGEQGVKLIEMIEVNRVDLKGGPCVTNTILPVVKPEMVSLSSWAHLNNLKETLSYIASKVGHKNIMIGEIGLERKNDLNEDEVREFLMTRVRQAMEWGVKYLILWQMSDWANGFKDCKDNQGKRMTAWFPFYRALHLDDDPLCIDDFQEIRMDKEGESLNLLGGKNSGKTVILNGALWLNKDNAEWGTSLEGLPIGNYRWLLIPFKGRGTISLKDDEGRTVSSDLKKAINLEEFTKRNIDLSKVKELKILCQKDEDLLIGGIYLSRRQIEIPFEIKNKNKELEIWTQVIGNSRINLPAGKWQIEKVELEAIDDMRDVRLKGEGIACPVADFLPAGSVIVLSSDGRGYFLLPNIRTRKEEGWALFHKENLQWNQDFAIFLPAKRDENCRLKFKLTLPCNIVGGEVWLTGQKSKKGDWWVEVRVGNEWVRCPAIFYYPGIPQDLRSCLPPEFSSIWGPARDIELAWVIRTEEDDWLWSTCIMSVRTKIFLDTLNAPLPQGQENLYLLQEGEGKGVIKLLLTESF
ncbi:hypothetical protein H5T87_06470 [bacterium]|nr:hypothetical protein [bacterium]